MPVDEDGLVIFFRDDSGGVVEMPSPEGTVRRFRLDGPVNPTIGTYLEVLDEQARAFERFGAQLAERQSRDTETLARQLRDEAEQTAIMVRAFPRVEFQTYLDGLQHRDQHLYDRLLREQRMEVASADLARRVFAAPDEPTRQSLTESLRGQLEEIFELKQQNRRDEIGQLELQLRELREQLSERERNRDAIISRRLESLVGQPHR